MDTVFFQVQLRSLTTDKSSLDNYTYNPLILKFLSKLFNTEITNEGLAKALFYPKVLGTSISTSFGSKIKKILYDLGLVESTTRTGFVFVDKKDSLKKYCVLKSGPNTINSGDIETLSDRLEKVRGKYDSLGVAIIYGENADLNTHYQKLKDTYQVYIGKDFWERLTGYENFYQNFISALDDRLDHINNGNHLFNIGLNTLEKEIEQSDLINNIL